MSSVGQSVVNSFHVCGNALQNAGDLPTLNMSNVESCWSNDRDVEQVGYHPFTKQFEGGNGAAGSCEIKKNKKKNNVMFQL